jgi:hypothetical protein
MRHSENSKHSRTLEKSRGWLLELTVEASLTEHEELLLKLWAEGTELLKYECMARHVAESGEVLRVLTMNSFHRLLVVNVSLHYGLTVFCKLAYVEQKGPEYGRPRGKAVEVKHVFICRPEGPYVAPAETLADLKNRYWEDREKVGTAAIGERSLCAH